MLERAQAQVEPGGVRAAPALVGEEPLEHPAKHGALATTRRQRDPRRQPGRARPVRPFDDRPDPAQAPRRYRCARPRPGGRGGPDRGCRLPSRLRGSDPGARFALLLRPAMCRRRRRRRCCWRHSERSLAASPARSWGSPAKRDRPGDGMSTRRVSRSPGRWSSKLQDCALGGAADAGGGHLVGKYAQGGHGPCPRLRELAEGRWSPGDGRTSLSIMWLGGIHLTGVRGAYRRRRDSCCGGGH